MTAEKILLNRFADFHKDLDELKKIADDIWYQGGMVWKVEFLKRAASTLDHLEYHNVFSDQRTQPFTAGHGSTHSLRLTY